MGLRQGIGDDITFGKSLVTILVYLGGRPEAGTATCRAAGSKKRRLFTAGNW